MKITLTGRISHSWWWSACNCFFFPPILFTSVTWPPPRISASQARWRQEGNGKKTDTGYLMYLWSHPRHFCMFWMDDLAHWSFHGKWHTKTVESGMWVKGYSWETCVTGHFIKITTKVLRQSLIKHDHNQECSFSQSSFLNITTVWS